MFSHDGEFEDLHKRIQKYLPILKARLSHLSAVPLADPSAFDLYNLVPPAVADSVHHAHLETSTAFRSSGFSSRYPDEGREIRNVLEKSKAILTNKDTALAYMVWLAKRRRPDAESPTPDPRAKTSYGWEEPEAEYIPVAKESHADRARTRAAARARRVKDARGRAEVNRKRAEETRGFKRGDESTSVPPLLDFSSLGRWNTGAWLALTSALVAYLVPILSVFAGAAAVICGVVAWRHAHASAAAERRRAHWILSVVVLLLLAIAWKQAPFRSFAPIPRNNQTQRLESERVRSKQSPPSSVADAERQVGYLEGTSGVDIAHLFYRGETGKEHEVDCSPRTAKLALLPGRYFVRIVGVGNKLIAREHEIQIRAGQTLYLGRD